MKLQFCKNCILPNSRPGLEIFDDGVCNACKGHEQKDEVIDWEERRQEFEEIIGEVKQLNRAYDCIVPVSGGKDSTYQIIKCKEYGLKPLAITWRSPGRSELGQHNLDNLIGIGVDHIDFTVNPEVERRFFYKTLVESGSIGITYHFGIYTIPLRLAVALNVPLVVWGESPNMEYGSTQKDRKDNYLDHDFLKNHGILHGTTTDSWVDDKMSAEDLSVYECPPESEFKRVGLRSIFIGYYLKWSPQESLRVAQAHGMKVREEGPKVGYYNFADIDCDFISIHHYLKWYKFGFTRLFDNLSLEIRNGHLTREQALEIATEMGEQTPYEDIKKFCAYQDISEDHFWEIVEAHRNLDIWHKDKGTWKIKDFITDNWSWK